MRGRDCRNCSNRISAVVCNFDQPASDRFEKMKQHVTYRPGQFVFYEGHPVLGLYILCEGRVKLTRSTKQGQQRIVGIVDAGRLIELNTFKDGALHQTSCQVLEMSQVCLVDRTQYLDLLEENGTLAVKVIQWLSHEMRHSLRETDHFAFASAKERVANVLLDLSERYGEKTKGGIHISLPLKREELAQMTVLTVETIVRILRGFQTDRLINLNGRNILVLQPDRLYRLVRHGRAIPSGSG